MPYPLPENVDPENDGCLIVFYPDEPEYRQALLGSLAGLESWNIWQRDIEKRGKIAAQRWKRSNLKTLAIAEITDCEFLDQLTEDGNMSINITNNVTCGQCGQAHSGQCSPVILYPPEVSPELLTEVDELPEQIDPGGEFFPDGFDDRAQYLLHKCKAARNLASDIRDTIFNMSRLSGIVAVAGIVLFQALITAPASGIISVLLAPLVLTVGTPAAIAIVGSILLLLVIGGGVTMLTYFGVLGSELDLDELTCRLYSATNEAQAKQETLDLLGETIGAIVFEDATQENLFTANVPTLVGALLPGRIFRFLFATNALIDEAMEGRFDGFDCTECESDPVGGWVATWSTGYSGTSVVNITLNTEDDFHANGDIHRGSQYGAYEFRVDHAIAAETNRISFGFVKNTGDQLSLRFSGQNVFSNMQTGTYLVAESSQPDEGSFDFVSIRPIPTNARWQFSTVYASSAPRAFDWELNDFTPEEV